MPYRAGFWIRTLAALIDLIAMMAISVGVGLAMVALESQTRFSITQQGASAVLYLLCLIYTSFEIWTAGTPGKLMLQLRIRNIDCTSADCARLVLRWSTKWLGMILSFLFLLSDWSAFYYFGGLINLIVFIGCFYAANDDRLSWHDQWASTAVCYVPRRHRSFEAIVPPPLPPR